MYEWASNWIKEVKLDEDGHILKINPFLDSMEFIRPISMEFGPDGSLYVLEWGSGFWGDNDDARVVRIDYVRGTRAPVPRIEAAPTNGAAPLEVHFSGRNSFDPDPGSVLDFAWDFTGDGEIDATGLEVVFTYEASGDYVAQLMVSDAEGNQGVAQVPISVGNTVPKWRSCGPRTAGFLAGEKSSILKSGSLTRRTGPPTALGWYCKRLSATTSTAIPLRNTAFAAVVFRPSQGTAAMATICFIRSKRAIQTWARSRWLL